MAAKKPAGIDMKRNYVTVTVCILEFHYKVRGRDCLTKSLALIYKSLVLALDTDQVFGLSLGSSVLVNIFAVLSMY